MKDEDEIQPMQNEFSQNEIQPMWDTSYTTRLRWLNLFPHPAPCTHLHTERWLVFLLTPFQILNSIQSLYCILGLFIIKVPEVPPACPQILCTPPPNQWPSWLQISQQQFDRKEIDLKPKNDNRKEHGCRDQGNQICGHIPDVHHTPITSRKGNAMRRLPQLNINGQKNHRNIWSKFYCIGKSLFNTVFINPANNL